MRWDSSMHNVRDLRTNNSCFRSIWAMKGRSWSESHSRPFLRVDRSVSSMWRASMQNQIYPFCPIFRTSHTNCGSYDILHWNLNLEWDLDCNLSHLGQRFRHHMQAGQRRIFVPKPPRVWTFIAFWIGALHVYLQVPCGIHRNKVSIHLLCENCANQA